MATYFVHPDDVPLLKAGKLLKPKAIVIDIIAHKGSGFPGARPLPLSKPTRSIGPNVLYYAGFNPGNVEPFADRASLAISNAVLPLLPPIIGGENAWKSHPLIRYAIRIHEGKVIDPAIETLLAAK